MEDRTLEIDTQTLRAWVDAAMERIVEHLRTLAAQPAGYLGDPGPPPAGLAGPMPEEGSEMAPLLDLFFNRVVPTSFNTAGPGYLAYIPGGGLLHSAVADLIADAVNRYVGVWAAAPFVAQIETDVVRWFADMLGLPSSARGLLTTGGSLANFTALVTARRERLPEDFFKGVLYTSDQAHHSVAKAALLAGFPARALVVIPSDELFRLRVDALAERLRADRARGLQPFLVVASAGTTNTGAVDDLEALAELCASERLWLHVDAAYGGFFALTAEGRRTLAGIERADSVVLDPHKGLFLPYGTGALVVRDGLALKRAHSIESAYMPPLQPDSVDGPQRIDFSEHGPELSREFRGLRVWLPFKLHGAGPFRRNLEEKLALARHAADRLRLIPGIEIVAEPQLSIVAFRLVRPGLDGEAIDALNRRLLAAVLAANRVWLTSTVLGGRFVIRICVLSFRTHQDRVDEALDLIRAAAADLHAAS